MDAKPDRLSKHIYATRRTRASSTESYTCACFFYRQHHHGRSDDDDWCGLVVSV